MKLEAERTKILDQVAEIDADLAKIAEHHAEELAADAPTSSASASLKRSATVWPANASDSLGALGRSATLRSQRLTVRQPGSRWARGGRSTHAKEAYSTRAALHCEMPSKRSADSTLISRSVSPTPNS